MSGSLRNILEELPGGNLVLRAYRWLKFSVYFRFIKQPEDLFTEYYEQKIWGEEESDSGPGSTLSFTEKLRAELPGVLKSYEIENILDAPCGDFNWMNKVLDEVDLEYTGGDIVQPLIESNISNYESEHIRFMKLDVTKDELPEADLWFCRDCLIHLSNRDVKKALLNFLDSEIPLLLTTTYPESKQNKNIATGDHRFLNLGLPPFNFPEAEIYLDDWTEGFPVKKMGLWKKEHIKEVIQAI